MAQPLLEGEIDNRDAIILGLREQIRQLHEELTTERSRNKGVEAGLSELRRITAPLYHALRLTHDELDAMGISAVSGNGATPSASPKWDTWRKRFPGRGAQLIDLLLVHGQMNAKQIVAALKCDPRTQRQLVYNLNQAGIMQKNGNMFSLREI